MKCLKGYDYRYLRQWLASRGIRHRLARKGIDSSRRLGRRLAAADVSVILDITAEVPHVFQGFAPILDEGAWALDRAGQFVRTALKQPARDLPPD